MQLQYEEQGGFIGRHFPKAEFKRRHQAAEEYSVLTTAIVVVNPLPTRWFWKGQRGLFCEEIA